MRSAQVGNLRRKRHVKQAMRTLPVRVTEHVAAGRLLVGYPDPVIKEAVHEARQRCATAGNSIRGCPCNDGIAHRGPRLRPVLQVQVRFQIILAQSSSGRAPHDRLGHTGYLAIHPSAGDRGRASHGTHRLRGQWRTGGGVCREPRLPEDAGAHPICVPLPLRA
jgi:hypothetical protein